MVILDLWGISFHPAVVVGSGNDLLFNSILAHCAVCFDIGLKCILALLYMLYVDHLILGLSNRRKLYVT